MISNKKADISMDYIVYAAIALVVLVIVIIVFYTSSSEYTTNIGEKAKSLTCEGNNYVCKPEADCSADKVKSDFFCGFGKVCCTS